MQVRDLHNSSNDPQHFIQITVLIGSENGLTTTLPF
jgi:hypothetical protein